MLIASHYVGFTFPGIIELPGSFSGRISSPMPDLGPELRNLISLAILNKLTETLFKIPWKFTSSSEHDKAWNLLVAAVNLYPVINVICYATFSSNPR